LKKFTATVFVTEKPDPNLKGFVTKQGVMSMLQANSQSGTFVIAMPFSVNQF